ncbi:MAG TPA: hypothetical protein VL334_22545 [Anaerolineae bacterium]|nr:hypothetical protein [Anaerolineae bacterium]
MSDWADAVVTDLERLHGLEHEHKRRQTILALVDARLAGRSEETVWDRPETCARSTWHGKWKHQPLMLDVLSSVDRAARRWSDTKTLRALAEAAEMLALASPAAAEQLIEIGTRGRLRYVQEGATAPQYEPASGPDVVRAALGVLDRAGVETAPKQQQQHGLTPELEAMIDRVWGSPSSAEDDD